MLCVHKVKVLVDENPKRRHEWRKDKNGQFITDFFLKKKQKTSSYVVND